jgi:hypothetical protein
VGHQKGAGEPRRRATKVEIQSNSELQSLTSSSTRSSGVPYLQIDTQDVYDHQFSRSLYACKPEISFLMQPVSWSIKI